MKRFLFAAFKITVFQVIFIAILAGIKYALAFYKITDTIQKPFIWFCLGAGAIFVLAVGIMGIIENSGKSFEEWKSKPNKTFKEKLVAGIASWGITIPVLLLIGVWVYLMTPTSVNMAIAFYAGIVIRNCIQFFSEKQAKQTTE